VGREAPFSLLLLPLPFPVLVVDGGGMPGKLSGLIGSAKLLSLMALLLPAAAVALAVPSPPPLVVV
jgi:ABC-type transport system involved in cytochrome c biogenesis permease component